MRKNQKLNKKNEEVVKDGPPWTVVAHFPTYSEAVVKVEEERDTGIDYDYKIKRYESDFRVKKRLRLNLMNKKKNNKSKK